MRLINVHSLELEKFAQSPPLFAILSHTWGASELLYQDFLNATDVRKSIKERRAELSKESQGWKKGWDKVLACCEKAKLDHLKYVWIDTCCIDKTNSTELTEAINSMYDWYLQSSICYAFLEDVIATGACNQERAFPGISDEHFAESRWFRRGWTLQELLAPRYITFLDRNWIELGTRSSLSKAISGCTGIDIQHLENTTSCNIATKMSWAANRQTSVSEDKAYSLLGLFGVRMPLIYGEGAASAFLRLQQELIKQSDDESIFAWGGYGLTGRLFAPSPNEFKEYAGLHVVEFDRDRQESFISNKGLIMSPRLYQSYEDAESNPNRFLIPLNYGTEDGTSLVALYVESRGFQYVRIANNKRFICSPNDMDWQQKFKLVGRRRICLRHEPVSNWKPFDSASYLILFSHSEDLFLRSAEQQSGISVLKSPRTPKLRLLPNRAQSDFVDESCFMTAGNFALAELTTTWNSEQINVGIAVRRCTGSLSLEAWMFESRDEHLARIRELADRPPPAAERRDFLELQYKDGPFIQIRLQARGFLETWRGRRIVWNDMAPAFSSSKTYIVRVFGPLAGTSEEPS